MNLNTLFSLSGCPNEAFADWESFLASYRQQFGKDLKVSGSESFLKLFGNSRFLTRFLIRHPEALKGKAPKLVPSADPASLLRKYKYAELLRITCSDLEGGPQESIFKELSLLARTIVQYADQFTLADLAKKYGPPTSTHAVLALGKLGGNELNYSSDIDLLAITQTDSGETAQITNHEFFIRQAQALSQLLQTSTEEGFLYRVDWDLRPEGKAGTLVNSLAALESYYSTFGADWERQMLTKASYLAGSESLGAEFIRMMTPFVYRRYLDTRAIERIQEMKHKIHAQLGLKNDTGFHVKLGVGGIREIEFFIQALLMLHGGQNEKLRGTNTLDVLQKLTQFQLVSPNEAHILREAYLFLRKLEHRLQLVEEAQTHLLRFDEKERLKTARRMGYFQESEDAALEHFQNDLTHHTAQVHHIFLSLFDEPVSKSHPSASSDPTHSVLGGYQEKLTQNLAIQNSLEEKADVLRLFKKSEIKLIQDSEQQHPSRMNILFSLSALAESICLSSIELATHELEAVYGKPTFEKFGTIREEAELLMVAMGKFGGQEIGYASDLDMIFIYSQNGETSGPKSITNQEYFARLVQKWISLLSLPTAHGKAYEIDTELRPSGHQGFLVTSLEGFLDYQRNASHIWEKQALLRARPLKTRFTLSKLFKQSVDILLFSQPFPKEIRKEMTRLKTRVELELAREGKYFIDIKKGLGGIMEIEFILQYAQLRFGYLYPALRVSNTFEGLDQLIALNLLPGREDAVLLKEAYTFYRTLESQFVIKNKRELKRLQKADALWDSVALEMSLDTGAKLLEVCENYRARVRAIYNNTLCSETY